MNKIFLILVLLTVPILVDAQSSVKEKSTGYGKTERDALEDARRKAVELGVEDLFSDRPQQMEVIKGKVTNKPTAYLKNEEITNKEFDTDTQKWEVTIRAVVSRSDLEKDVGAIDNLLDRVNRPKILVMSTYYSGENPLKKLTDLSVNTIDEYLGRLGFTYISQDAIGNIMQNMASISGSQDIKDIALKANAPYYITVNVSLDNKGQNQNTGAYYASANINLEAFDSENGTGTGTANQSSGNVGSMLNQEDANYIAIKEASIKATDQIVEQILLNFNRIAERGGNYEIRIFGITDYLIAREFKNALTNHNGFSGDIRMSKQDDYYRFEITFKSPRPDEVVDAIFDALSGKTNFRRLNIKSTSGKLINFEIN
ncbi:MAG: hypothetical protein M1480_10575 [Bacteroidetes bacterium]|nr:hypothetical protein [Bacteroidota bacterium]